MFAKTKVGPFLTTYPTQHRQSLPKDDLRCAIASCELRCAVASCAVLVQTHFFESCDVRACGAFLGLQSAIATSHIFKQ